jgi:hypothetical protein
MEDFRPIYLYIGSGPSDKGLATPDLEKNPINPPELH